MYFERLRPGGVLLIHFTNRYLDLGAEIEALATVAGKELVHVHSPSDRAKGVEAADWAIAGSDLAEFRAHGEPPSARRVRPWTDDFSSLLPLWK
jgi:hypothetical protein